MDKRPNSGGSSHQRTARDSQNEKMARQIAPLVARTIAAATPPEKKREKKWRDYGIAAVALLAEYFGLIYGHTALLWVAMALFWMAALDYTADWKCYKRILVGIVTASVLIVSTRILTVRYVPKETVERATPIPSVPDYAYLKTALTEAQIRQIVKDYLATQQTQPTAAKVEAAINAELAAHGQKLKNLTLSKCPIAFEYHNIVNGTISDNKVINVPVDSCVVGFTFETLRGTSIHSNSVAFSSRPHR